MPEARPGQGWEQLGICNAVCPGRQTHTRLSPDSNRFAPCFCTVLPSAVPEGSLAFLPCHALPNASSCFSFASALPFLLPFQGSSKRENSLCRPLTCEELLVKPTAHQMAGISCARSADGWRCLSPLSAPILAMCTVVEGFGSILLIKEKRKCVYYC